MNKYNQLIEVQRYQIGAFKKLDKKSAGIVCL
jgi:hypothetical protein